MRRSVALVALATSVALVGCSSDSEERGDQARTQATSTAKPGCSYDRETLLPAMKAAVDDDATLQMTMGPSGADAEVMISAQIAYRRSGVEMKLRSEVPGQEYAMILADGRIFIADGAQSQAYEEIPAKEPAFAKMQEQLAGMDVRDTFRNWDAGLLDVEALGAKQIDGESVCSYLVTVDSAKAAAADGEAVPQGCRPPSTTSWR